jgi:hypothetical protein
MKIPQRLLENEFDKQEWKQIQNYLNNKEVLDVEILPDNFVNSIEVYRLLKGLGYLKRI